MLRRCRDDLVALAPAEREGAEVHAVGGVLGQGDVVGSWPNEAGRGLAGALPELGLAGVEARAFQVGGARAEVVGGAEGFDHGVRRWAAAARVQVDEVILDKGRKPFTGQARVAGDACLLPGRSGFILYNSRF